jgi:hypothetical protein
VNFNKDEEDKEVPKQYQETRKEYIERKTKEGYKIYFPEDNDVCIDIDNKESLDTFERILEKMVIKTLYSVPTYKTYNSTTPGHMHIIVKWPWKLTPVERILIQLLLGSDPTRELLSTIRVWDKDDHPTLLAMKGDTVI